MFAVAALAVFGVVGTAAAATVVQAPVHSDSPSVTLIHRGMVGGQLTDNPVDYEPPHHTGCGLKWQW